MLYSSFGSKGDEAIEADEACVYYQYYKNTTGYYSKNNIRNISQ